MSLRHTARLGDHAGPGIVHMGIPRAITTEEGAGMLLPAFFI